MPATEVHSLDPYAAAEIDGRDHGDLAVRSPELPGVDPESRCLDAGLRRVQSIAHGLVGDRGGGPEAGETEGVVVVPVRQHHRYQGHLCHRRHLGPQPPPLLGRGTAVHQHRPLGADHQTHGHLGRTVLGGEGDQRDVHVVGHRGERAGSLGHVTRLALGLPECQRHPSRAAA